MSIYEHQKPFHPPTWLCPNLSLHSLSRLIHVRQKIPPPSKTQNTEHETPTTSPITNHASECFRLSAFSRSHALTNYAPATALLRPNMQSRSRGVVRESMRS